MISWVKLVFPLTVKHDYLTGHVLWGLYKWRLAWVSESQGNLPGWCGKISESVTKERAATSVTPELHTALLLPPPGRWQLCEHWKGPISGPQLSPSGKWEDENKKAVGFASGHKTHKEGKLLMKIVEKNCSCNHSTKLKMLDWHQNPLAHKWHRNDQISPNPIFVLPDSTGKEPKVIIFQVSISGLYCNVTFKHTETN